jgi:hypothetical protein
MEENLAWAGHVACMADMRKALNTSVRIPEGKRHLGRCRHRSEDNIKDTRVSQMKTVKIFLNLIY